MWQQRFYAVSPLRAGLCCPGCKGSKLEGSSWRSPAGWSTPLSSGCSPNTVSSHCIIHSVCLCSSMLQLSSVCWLYSLPICPAQSLTLFPSFIFLLILFLSVARSALILFLVSHVASFITVSIVVFYFISVSPSLDAEVHYVNTTALTKGHLQSSFWVVDRRHFYIGSASMDWRSLATVSETHHTSQHITAHTNTHWTHADSHKNRGWGRKCNIIFSSSFIETQIPQIVTTTNDSLHPFCHFVSNRFTWDLIT